MLRIPHLGESIWWDELWASHLLLGTPSAAYGTVMSDVHPPFYTLLMFLWIHLLGDSEISIRIIPLLAGLATIAVAQVGLRPALGRGAAAWTGLLLALSPVHIWYSQEARSYSLLILLILLSYVLWQRGALRQERARRWGYPVTVAAAMLTHYYAVAFGVAQSVLAIFRPPAERRRIWLATGAGLGLLAAFVGLRIALTGGLATESWYLRPFTPFELWMVITTWAPTGHAIWQVSMWTDGFESLLRNPTLLASQLLVLGLTVAGVRSLLREPSPGRPAALDYLAMCLCLPLLLTGLALWRGGNNFVERAFLPALPFLFGLWGRGITSFRLGAVRSLAGAASGALLVIALWNYFQKPDRWTVYKPNADWRGAAAYLDARRPPIGRQSLLLVTSPAGELTYYGVAEEGPGTRPWRIVAASGLATGDLCALASGNNADRRYVVHNRYWANDVQGLINRLKTDCGVTGTAEAEFKGLTLVRLRESGER